MTSRTPDLDLGDLPEPEWLARLDALGDEHGFAEPLGQDHLSLFVESGKKLLVTFGTMDAARHAPGGLPHGLDHVARNGWSVLALLSRGDTWFRDRHVWRHFDRLTDDGFFEDFETVLFTGAGPGGYAAAAFSVAAPGARVLAVRPQATLDPAVAGWDRRYPPARRRDFASRYGYAPAMIEAADSVHLLLDPLHAPDAMHAALFRRPNVTVLRCRHAGPRPEVLLDALQISPRLLDLAMDGRLDAIAFARLWRERRTHGPYLRALLRRLDGQGRDRLAAQVCRHGLSTADAPLFARRLQRLDPRPVHLLRPQSRGAA